MWRPLGFFLLTLPVFAQDRDLWIRTWDDAIRAAEQSGRPIFIFFGCD